LFTIKDGKFGMEAIAYETSKVIETEGVFVREGSQILPGGYSFP
jgi:hypothetical protein